VLDEDLQALFAARDQLENPGWIARTSSQLGQMISSPIDRLPNSMQASLNNAVELSIRKAMDLAIQTIDVRASGSKPIGKGLDKALSGISGAAGGALGIGGLVAELPVSTTLMLRSIARIALEHGEDLSHLEARLACIQVFALGGQSATDDHAESGYFVIRASLAQCVSEALKQAASSSSLQSGTPVLLKFIKMVAARFGMTVSQKAAAQMVPVLGAIGGSAVNVAFTHHYQCIAEAHFCVRKLERKYGADAVQSAYFSTL